MLQIVSAERESVKLRSGEWMHYFALPKLPYDFLKVDFADAPHLAAIDKLDLKGAGGVLVKCRHIHDGYLAALYIFKKYLKENMPDEAASTDDEDEDPMPDDDEDLLADAEHWEDKRLIDSILFAGDGGNEISHIPVITSEELTETSWRQEGSFGVGPLHVGWEGERKNKGAYWIRGDFPLIVEGCPAYELLPKEGLKFLEMTKRFYIYLYPIREFSSECAADRVSPSEKSAFFELNMEYCALGKPELDYYEKLLEVIVKKGGYELSDTLDRRKLLKDLIQYRGHDFRSSLDIDILVKKAIRKKKGDSTVLTHSDFDQLFLATAPQAERRDDGKPSRAAEELGRLIGMAEVKRQIKRLAARLKLDKLRRNAGLASAPSHAAAVFLGSPGTAKTTVARILGKMLQEEQVLTSDVFMEISRKDMIGKYLGHTAPLVADIFRQAKGGTIFIDEAYSLMSRDSGDIYSDEALSELIRQMENHPDTLVIFAGYGEEMKNFIKHANPGLRSRLTNIIEFPDYSAEELTQIFILFASREGYRLEDRAAAERAVMAGLNELKKLRADNLGNGRLMRKWFAAAVGYMAERENNDLRTITTGDIEHALADMLAAERFVSDVRGSSEKIGFVL